MAKFVTIQHPDVETTGYVSETALPYLAEGWTVVEVDEDADPKSPDHKPSNRKKASE